MSEQEKKPAVAEAKEAQNGVPKSDKTAEKTNQNPKSDEEVVEPGLQKRQKISETKDKVKSQEEEKKEPK